MLKTLINTFVLPKDDTKLQLSELRYRRLFETALDGILILDADSGKIDDVNPFLKNLLGYSQEELLGKQLWEIGIFKDIAASQEAFEHLLEKGSIRYKDLPLQRKDGKYIDVEFVNNIYMVGSQKVIQCNVRDITGSKKSEKILKNKTLELEEISKSQEKTKKAMLNVMEDLEIAKETISIEKVKDEAMLDSIGEGLIAVDNDKKIVVMNKAAENMLGRNGNDLIGEALTKLVLEDDQGTRISLDIQLAHMTSHSTTINNKYFFVRNDTTKFPISLTVTSIKIEDKILGTIYIFRDISREKEIDRAKSEFVSIASHQLRTPLGIMKWYLEALGNEDYFKKSPPVIQGYFDEIYKSNERELSLVRDLLSVSRIDQGHVKNVPKLVDTLSVIKEIVKQMQILADKKKVTLHLLIQDQKIPLIHIDILRFHEVIENLIANAIEYSLAEGTVTVTVKRLHDLLIVDVKDTGIGIAEPDQKKLFTKFFRSEKAIGHNPEGSGLGLYVVKSYMEGWGGKTSFETLEGKGSTFTISLPINQEKMGGE